jgi:cytidine deaminase
MHNRTLLRAAQTAKENSYSPYSKFRVGAALLTKSGKIYSGCNIENSSFSLTVCAERTAIFKAISEGEKEFVKILIVSDDDGYCPPCGACRQVLSDLAGDIEIVMVNSEGDELTRKITDLLPLAFGSSYLNKL